MSDKDALDGEPSTVDNGQKLKKSKKQKVKEDSWMQLILTGKLSIVIKRTLYYVLKFDDDALFCDFVPALIYL